DSTGPHTTHPDRGETTAGLVGPVASAARTAVAGRDLEPGPQGGLELLRPRTLGGQHVRRFVDRLEGLGVGDEAARAAVDRPAHLLEDVVVPEDEQMHPDDARLVEAGRIKADRG